MPMISFGLTGGVGMGKSTAASLLVQRGVPLIDTDEVARRVVQPGQPAWTEICDWLGPQIVGPDGQLLREHLARLVFSDAEARRKLEAITHPRIRAAWQSQVREWTAGGWGCCVVVIPLLFETGAQKEFTHTLCVVCGAASQRQRLRARGWPDEHIEQRLAAQLLAAEKCRLASFVIWNEAGVDVLEEQLRRIPGLF